MVKDVEMVWSTLFESYLLPIEVRFASNTADKKSINNIIEQVFIEKEFETPFRLSVLNFYIIIRPDDVHLIFFREKDFGNRKTARGSFCFCSYDSRPNFRNKKQKFVSFLFDYYTTGKSLSSVNRSSLDYDIRTTLNIQEQDVKY